MAEKGRLDLLRGTLDLLILKTLTWGPAHGYAITAAIHRATDGALLIEEGALYPALYRMEEKGWIEGPVQQQSARQVLPVDPCGTPSLSTAGDLVDRVRGRRREASGLTAPGNGAGLLTRDKRAAPTTDRELPPADPGVPSGAIPPPKATPPQLPIG